MSYSTLKNNYKQHVYEHGKKNFLLKTALYTFGGITTSLGIGLLARDYDIHPVIKCIAIPASFVSIFFLHSNDNHVEYKMLDDDIDKELADEDLVNNNEYKYPVLSNTLTQKIAFATLCSGLGFSLEYLLKEIQYDNILLPATITSLLTFGSSAYYGYKNPQEVSRYRNIAYSGLTALVNIGFTCSLAYLIFGPNSYSSIMMDMKTYIGIPIFMLISACDSAKTLEYYDKKHPDAIICATDHYLNYMNILIKIIKVMKNDKDKKNNDKKKETK